MQCDACGHLQLVAMVDPEFHYREFRYYTGLSLGLRDHFEDLVTGLVRQGDIAAGRFVVDIGSNDGSLLRFAAAGAARILGIDPAEEIARAATASGIPTLPDFFDVPLAERIAAEHGLADVVICNNTIANIDDLNGFFVGLDRLMAPDGLLVIETQYGLDVMTRMLLDVIYHEHVSYFTVRPFAAFLAARGFELCRADRIAPKGGSIRFQVQRAGGRRPVNPGVAALISEETDAGLYDCRLFEYFNRHIVQVAARTRAKLLGERARGRPAMVYGASVGCAALIHYLGLCDTIDVIIDDNPLVRAVQTASGPIAVREGRTLATQPAADVVVLAWRYGLPIARSQAAFRARGGRFFAVLPDLAEVDPGERAQSAEAAQ